jgi:hypothetical protein
MTRPGIAVRMPRDDPQYGICRMKAVFGFSRNHEDGPSRQCSRLLWCSTNTLATYDHSDSQTGMSVLCLICSWRNMKQVQTWISTDNRRNQQGIRTAVNISQPSCIFDRATNPKKTSVLMSSAHDSSTAMSRDLTRKSTFRLLQ